MKAIEWKKIESEYLSDELATLRSLSEKYGVSKQALFKHSAQENWRAKKEQRGRKYYAKREEIAIERKAINDERQANNIYVTSSEIVDKVVEMMQKPEFQTPNQLKMLSATLKDCKELQKILLDNREQIARIEQLERQVENMKNGAEQGISIRIEGGKDAFDAYGK